LLREAEEPPHSAEVAAALDALAARDEAGAPAWADVLARAAALPICAFTDPREDAWQ
jgi:hypothetical protein